MALSGLAFVADGISYNALTHAGVISSSQWARDDGSGKLGMGFGAHIGPWPWP